MIQTSIVHRSVMLYTCKYELQVKLFTREFSLFQFD